MNVYGKRSQRGSPDAIADQLITELESEFDLMRLERHMADLERKDERLVEKITALKAGIEAPVGTPAYAALREPGPIRRWGRALAAECEIFWLKSRRKRLAEDWRRYSILADDIKFGLRVTGVGYPRD
jgi:hypothetical protein